MNRFPFPPYRSGIPHWTERVVTYCAKVLPIVFDNSLSYYEFLGHLQVKLNEVIKALNSQNLVFVEFTHMIELELQNFEKYMEERQDNFEQQMQEEWHAFKTEMEEAWQAFKTAMEEAWQEYKDEMDEAWADFQADMLQRFQTFQETITAQQTAFETRMEAVQQQFEDDMENRADTFEQTITDQQNAFEQNVETELEEWKDIAIRAILDTIRLELPDLISDVISGDLLAPIITRQGFAKIVSTSYPESSGYLDLTNEHISVYKNGQEVPGITTLADLGSIQIEPGTAIVFIRYTLFDEISSGEFLSRALDLPANGYTLSVGLYKTDGSMGSIFENDKYHERSHFAITNGTVQYTVAGLGMSVWEGDYVTRLYPTVVFQADPDTPAFTCDYSDGIRLSKPDLANIVFEDQRTGGKYLVPKQQGITVDQTYDAQSVNAQSGVAVAQAVAAIPTVTVDQTVNYQSTNPASSKAISDYGIIKNTSEKTVSITQAQSTAMATATVDMLYDYPVGTLFLVTISNALYCGSDVIPLSGTDASTSTNYWTLKPITLSHISSHSIVSAQYYIALGKGANNDVTIYYTLSNTSGLTGNWNIRVQKLSLTSRSNTL